MKTEKATFLFLGTGGSMGVPVIGCPCEVCHSTVSFNKRLRPSGLITIGQRQILIDCGPDFRQQALRHNITKLDAMILTHAHHDHVGGLDDLRIFYIRNREALPSLMSTDTYRDLNQRFGYIFATYENEAILTTKLDVKLLLQERGEINFADLRWRYFTYEQCGMSINGFRSGSFAYVSDIKHYPKTLFEDLEGVKTLVISALRYTPSPFHLSLDEAVDFAQKVKADRTWITHIGHELDHDKANAYLPTNIRLAYDGMIVEFEAEVAE